MGLGSNVFPKEMFLVQPPSFKSGVGKFTQLFITAGIQSLEQGNVLNSLCQGFCPQGGAWSWAVWSQGELVLGGVWSWGCLVLGGTWWRPPPPGWLLLQAVHILLECILVPK